MPHLREGRLDRPESRLEVPEGADAHVADAEDAALQAILASRHDRPVGFAEDFPERRIVDARRISDRGNGVRSKTWVR